MEGSGAGEEARVCFHVCSYVFSLDELVDEMSY